MPLSTMVVRLLGDAGDFKAELERAAQDTQDFGDRVQAAGKIALGVAGGAIVALGAAVATIGPKAISAASDLSESMSKANVVFGASTAIVEKFAETSDVAFGITKRAAYEASGTFGNLFTTMGLGQSAAAGMSVDIVKLAGDLASFNNLKTEDVLEKLRSGLVGEAEPLRALGVNISEAAVQAKAMSMNLGGLVVDSAAVTKAEGGVYEATKRMYAAELQYGAGSMEHKAKVQALTDAQNKLNSARRGSAGPLTDAMKLQARYALIMDQTKTAQGDFARTSDGLANSQRILSAVMENLMADVGTTFLPIVIEFTKQFASLAKMVLPSVQSALKGIQPLVQDVANSVGIFIEVLTRTGNPIEALSGALENFPTIKPTVDSIIVSVQNLINTISPYVTMATTWISQNVSIKDVLIALGIAVASVVIPAIISLVAAVAPIVLAFAAVVAVVALVRTAWEENWGGMRDTLTAAWNGTILPALQQLWAWLQVNVPAAIKTVSNFWTGTLQPALAAVWGFIQGSVIPILGEIWNWLAINVPAAIQTLSNFWTNTLLPAINAVWLFITTSVIPIFEALANVYIAAVRLAAEAMAGVWQNVVLPALTAIWTFATTMLMPWINTLITTVRDILNPILNALAVNFLQPVANAFGNIGMAIQTVIGWLNGLAERINSLTLPAWLTPGSPTPFETALVGVAGGAELVEGALQKVALMAEHELNRVLGGENGTISDLEMIKGIAHSSLGTIADPLQATFFLVRDAAAEAGSAAGGVLSILQEIKAIGTINNYIYTHHVDVYEPSIDNTGGGGTGGGTCFVGGTPVTMADGSTKAIEQIRIGDKVLGWDTEARTQVEAEVSKVFHHSAKEMCGYIVVINGAVGVTPEHPLYANLEWVDVGYLRPGDVLMRPDGLPVMVRTIEMFEERRPVYHLHTSHETHNYFAGGILAHNAQTGKASGGNVMAGMAYLVGERGPELFVPGLTGSIVPNRILEQLAARPVTTPALGGKGDVHLYGDVVIYGQERSVLEELQAMA